MTTIERHTYLEILEEFMAQESSRRKKGRFEKFESTPCEAAIKSGLNKKRDWREVLERKRFFQECPEGYQIDHIIPRAKGGSDYLDNLQWLPKYLNLVKRDYLIQNECEYPHCVVEIKKILSERALRKENIEC